MEQVEFSNVVVLNKGDLVSEEQQRDIVDKISLINPRAKIVKTVQSKIDVVDILNTHLYEANKDQDDFLVAATKKAEKEKKETIEAELPDCCKISVDNQQMCCDNKKLLDSGVSQVSLKPKQLSTTFNFFVKYFIVNMDFRLVVGV